MKKIITTILLSAATVVAVAQNDHSGGIATVVPNMEKVRIVDRWRHNAPRSIFSNFGVGLNAGISGFGISAATPLGKNFNLIAGFDFMPLPIGYPKTFGGSFDVMDQLENQGVDREDVDFNTVIEYDVDGRIKLNNAPSGHVLVDFSPTKSGFGAFHITAGLYFGGRDIIRVHGDSNIDRLQQSIDGMIGDVNASFPGVGDKLDLNVTDMAFNALGDAGVHLNADGTANVYARVNNVKPYLGVGWGNAIPRGRVGFRFDIGAMYMGRPNIVSPNADIDIEGQINDDTLSDILDKVHFLPQISLSLTFRILKD